MAEDDAKPLGSMDIGHLTTNNIEGKGEAALREKAKFQKMIKNQIRGLPPIDMMVNMPAPAQANTLEVAPENLVSLEPVQQESVPGQ